MNPVPAKTKYVLFVTWSIGFVIAQKGNTLSKKSKKLTLASFFH